MELGGGLALTGGAYVGAEGGITSTNRWLRFDFNDPNHRSLIILGGTSFTIGENIVTINETTSYNLSDYISEEGADYYVFINADGRVIASTVRTPADGYMFIGQFHTLCADCNENMTGLIPVEFSNIGTSLTLQNYFKERDLDFYNFYTKTSLAQNNGNYYNVATVDHPLSGFKAGDILPESVWCLNWHPSSKSWDGMVWCNGANCCVDIYLQSGEGYSTVSEYGGVHTVNRQFLNHQSDMESIGKKLISQREFRSVSIGSNCLTNIQGGDQTYVGGHVDTSNRRMISFIGCEECCGYLWQWNDELCDLNEDNREFISDGRGLLGKGYDILTSIQCGGTYVNNPPISGPRATHSVDNFWHVASWTGGRGVCDISIV